MTTTDSAVVATATYHLLVSLITEMGVRGDLSTDEQLHIFEVAYQRMKASGNPHAEAARKMFNQSASLIE